MIRLGLIGCGDHSASGHALPLARYKAAHPDQIELAAVCDLQEGRAQAFCSGYGFKKAYREVEEMLSRETLDGCVAVVPVAQISGVGVRLLGRGIACVVEKPLGASLSQARELRDTARATGTPNMVSVNRRFMPFLNQAMEWTRNTGSLRYVRGTLARNVRREPEFLWTTAVHAVDTLRHVAGPVASAQIRTMRGGETPWYAMDLRFESGVSGHLDVLPTAGMVEEVYEWMGEGFCVSVTCPFGSQRGWRGFQDGRLLIEQVETAESSEHVLNGCYDEAAEFIRAVSSKTAPRPSIEEVFPSVELCLALAKHVEEGRAESVAVEM
jgi:myo-inositol 2-dehydrogenase / D-chiro-inositol 1-dehydrogenase